MREEETNERENSTLELKQHRCQSLSIKVSFGKNLSKQRSCSSSSSTLTWAWPADCDADDTYADDAANHHHHHLRHRLPVMHSAHRHRHRWQCCRCSCWSCCSCWCHRAPCRSPAAGRSYSSCDAATVASVRSLDSVRRAAVPDPCRSTRVPATTVWRAKESKEVLQINCKVTFWAYVYTKGAWWLWCWDVGNRWERGWREGGNRTCARHRK